VTGPDGPLDAALAAAFSPPDGLRTRPDAGARLRARAASRQVHQAAAGVTTSLVVVAVAVLMVGAVLHGQLTGSPDGGSGGAPLFMAQSGAGPGDDGTTPPVLPWSRSASPSGRSYGASTLTHPLEVMQVERVARRECPALQTKAMQGMPVPDDTCYGLVWPAVLVVRQLIAVDVAGSGSGKAAGVALTLVQKDSVILARYTQQHVGSQVAFRVAGRVWWTAEIGRPVETGVIEIAAGRTEADAVELVASLGLRRAVKPQLVPKAW
jgi:hypothetical protein